MQPALFDLETVIAPEADYSPPRCRECARVDYSDTGLCAACADTAEREAFFRDLYWEQVDAKIKQRKEERR